MWFLYVVYVGFYMLYDNRVSPVFIRCIKISQVGELALPQNWTGCLALAAGA
jgi:hypothetical protein